MSTPKLPRFPLHLGDWLSDPHIKRLSKAERYEVLELLWRQWLDRGVPERPAEVSDATWDEYLRVAPGYANERVRQERGR